MSTVITAASVKADQPIVYAPTREPVEPDWTRIPAFRQVSRADWESATWQRRHTVKNLRELKAALGQHLSRRPCREHRARSGEARDDVDPRPAAHAEHDEPRGPLGRPGAPLHAARASPIGAPTGRTTRGHRATASTRRHVGRGGAHPPLPHQGAGRDCSRPVPQYCGHCTRMDLVGNDVPAGGEAAIRAAAGATGTRQILDYLRRTPVGARRRGLGRRHREPAHRPARGLRRSRCSTSPASATSASHRRG